MELRFSPEAIDQIAERRAWWVENRADARDAFDQDLDSALATIVERGASFPAVSRRQHRAIRRLLLPRLGCHLYFELDGVAGATVILSAWGARMRRLPPLAKAMR